MTTTDTPTQTRTVQVHRVYIKAPAQVIWDAITTPEWTARYGYRGPAEFDLRPGGAYRCYPTEEMKQFGAPDVVVDGEVIESDPPHKLVQTWKMYFAPELIAEDHTTLTWEIHEEAPGLCALTVTHDVTGAPVHGAQTSGGGALAEGGGGWPFILSDLKSLLETGSAFEL